MTGPESYQKVIIIVWQASDLLTVHFNIIQNYRFGGIMYNEEAYTIYQQAEAFKLAYERCMMCINQNGAIILPIPAMVNSAFSVELFLKAVIKEKTSECRSHKLSDFSDAFVDFRYIYEDIFKTKDLNLKFWEDFSSAIYKIVPTHIARKGAPLYIDPSIK